MNVRNYKVGLVRWNPARNTFTACNHLLDKIRITFTKLIDRVLCTIDDDGVGRERAVALRQQKGENHHSRGLQITRDRLALCNRRFNLDMTFDIADMHDEMNQPAGTRVKVWFPLDEK